MMMNTQYIRQSFLGERSQEIISSVLVGIVGLGGGGSHVVQQLAHIGFQKFRLFDPDIIEKSNLNRLVGGTQQDVLAKRPKVEISERVVSQIQFKASVEAFKSRWQDEPSAIRSCDLIFSCVDGYGARAELEVAARRYMIPLIDIGMDVYEVEGSYSISGQIILSLPDNPCMRCMGFLTKDRLAEEGRRYGDVGSNPQVVWSNGVLASTAVGVGVELLTNWAHTRIPPLYLCYDGKRGLIQPHPFLGISNVECSHFPSTKVGDPKLI